MSALAGLSGVLVVAGVWFTVVSWRRVPPTKHARRVHWGWDQRRWVTALAAGLVGLVLTRWPIGALAAGAVGWFAAGPSARRARREVEARTEALALWCEMLRDAIGGARGVEGVLVATSATAPLPIRPEVQRMAARLEHEPLELVLDELAHELDHPVGDLVVAALRLTSSAGGRQVRDVLADLAAAAYAEADSHRRIEVARERPRAAMRYAAMVIVGFVVVMAVFSRSYLEPYDTATGQVVLVVVAAYWALGFWWMHHMARVVPVERFLARAPVLLAASDRDGGS
jgi:Flp pilus assembly protein TadB